MRLQDIESLPPFYRDQVKAHLERFKKAAVAKRNKFHAIRCEDTLFPCLRGTVFSSKVERGYAHILAARLMAKEIHNLRFHPSYRIGPAGIHYLSDFEFAEDGKLVTVEVKGVETPRWKMIMQLWAVHGVHELRVVKRTPAGLKVVKVIPGGGK